MIEALKIHDYTVEWFSNNIATIERFRIEDKVTIFKKIFRLFGIIKI